MIKLSSCDDLAKSLVVLISWWGLQLHVFTELYMMTSAAFGVTDKISSIQVY